MFNNCARQYVCEKNAMYNHTEFPQMKICKLFCKGGQGWLWKVESKERQGEGGS